MPLKNILPVLFLFSLWFSLSCSSMWHRKKIGLVFIFINAMNGSNKPIPSPDDKENDPDSF